MKQPLYNVEVIVKFSARQYEELMARMKIAGQIKDVCPVDSEFIVVVNSKITSFDKPVPQDHDTLVDLRIVEDPPVAFELDAGIYSVSLNVGSKWQQVGYLYVDQNRSWRYDIHVLTYDTLEGELNSIQLGVCTVNPDLSITIVDKKADTYLLTVVPPKTSREPNEQPF